jgi:hypothetical protein
VPIYRSSLVPLEDLPRLLLAADVHLVTLRDAFVGYVLPSKIHACIDSGKRVLFIGSQNSDVHFLASRALSSNMYYRIDVGDVEGLVNALHTLEKAVHKEHDTAVVPEDLVGSSNRTSVLRANAESERSAIGF